MKSSAIVCVIAAASLSLGSVSGFAQGRVYDRNASNNPEIYRQTHPEDQSGRDLQGGPVPNLDRRAQERRELDRREQVRRENERREFERRQSGRRDFDHRDFNRERYYYGARSPEFYRGGYIPREYRSRQYVVNDWYSHSLYAPPRGYQWVQVGADYVLIDVATGLIANLMLSQ